MIEYIIDTDRFAGMMDTVEDHVDSDLASVVWDMVWRLRDDIVPIVDNINRKPELLDTYKYLIRHYVSMFKNDLVALYDSDKYYHDDIELVKALTGTYLDDVISVRR